ncbi:hypothetical protein GCM10018952_54340 [Streptosporangium vulgare]
MEETDSAGENMTISDGVHEPHGAPGRPSETGDADALKDAAAERSGLNGWLDGVRSTRAGRLTLKIVIGAIGAVLVIGGLIMVPFPGPRLAGRLRGAGGAGHRVPLGPPGAGVRQADPVGLDGLAGPPGLDRQDPGRPRRGGDRHRHRPTTASSSASTST